MSCATCHVQEKGFECGIDNPRFPGGKTFGLGGKSTPHYMLPLVNLVYNNNGYFWNGFVSKDNPYTGAAAYGVPAEEPYDFKNIESTVWMAITAPHEMNGNIERTVNTIANIDMYPPMFKAAFGTEEVTYDRISKAISQFVRSIISYRSKFHKYLRHEAELSPTEKRGHDLFFSEDADCFHCHGGSVLMTTNQYYNNAKDNVFKDKSDRYSVTGDPMDMGAYRAPSLINVELTAPYMHDGRFKTLDEVIDFYSAGLIYSDFVHPLMKAVRYRGVQLSDQDKKDLKAFLLTLTDRELINDPAYSCPPELKEWNGQAKN
jgi:cytochrome c peroxidase